VIDARVPGECGARVRAEVVERVAAAMKAVRIGSWDEDPDMGPLVNERQFERVRGFLDETRSSGAKVVTGGAATGDGWYVQPTVYDDVDSQLRVVREEVFGPVLAIQPFAGLAHATELMNATDFGLLACIWTNDVSRALRLAKTVRAGQVAVNQFHDAGVIGFPFNMQKDSGFSRGGGYGAMREYTQEKAVAIRLLDR
jgi:aldehyde dehydrogenase (NAD+)